MREKRTGGGHHHHPAMVSLPPPPPLPNREMLLQPPPHRSSARPPPAPTNHFVNSYFREEQRAAAASPRGGGASSAWRYNPVGSSPASTAAAEAVRQEEGEEYEEEEDDEVDDEEEDECSSGAGEQEESTLKERASNTAQRVSARRTRPPQQNVSDSEETEDELSSSELTSSSDVQVTRRQKNARRFVPTAPPPRPAHATRATATEDLTTTGCEEDWPPTSSSCNEQRDPPQQQQQVMSSSIHSSSMQDSTHSSLGSKAASRTSTEDACSSTPRARSESRQRPRRHFRSSASHASSLERARQRMKSAPPGDCCGDPEFMCPYSMQEEQHMHTACHMAAAAMSPHMTLPHHMHRYSYHGPPSCACHLAAEPPPPYDYFRWRYLLKSPIGDAEERMQRLETEKDQLRLQVSVLSEQVEAQADKLVELERLLDDKKRELNKTEESLQLEMLARSSLETQKLELMADVADMKRRQALMERQHMEIHDRAQRSEAELATMVMQVSEERRKLREKPPVAPRPSTGPLANSTPYNSILLGDSPSKGMQYRGTSPSPSLGSSLSTTSPLRRTLSSSAAGDATLEDNQLPPRTPPSNARHKVDHCGTLPRHKDAAGVSSPDLDAFRPSRKATVVFGKSFLLFRAAATPTGSRSCSAPNLAETEKEIEPRDENSSLQANQLHQQNKNKGIKRIFGRLKRSGSGSLDELPGGENEFQRGGVRATAGGRLGWSRDTQQDQYPRNTDPEIPLSEWDTDAICGWLLDMGLEAYVPEARRWVKNGRQLATASNHDLEKELGLKNGFHRKKLQLLVAALGVVDPSPPDTALLRCAAGLDTAWVLRWLDDAGLPQHKEAFLAARVDGPVLHRLTNEDLVALHVTSCLHAASFRRGIQVLREQQFNPNCLLRRSVPDERKPPTADEVALWTNHRVMEWLRAVDLAEYAPNMRGSGVHGALMVHEPRFTAELLASLLAIPPHKTLLRRHLSTHFQELVGREKILEKRHAEAMPGHVPLTATAKLKPTKRSQFTLKRKKLRAEMELDDLVCPLDSPESNTGEQLVAAPDALQEPPGGVAVCLGNSFYPGADRTSNV